MNSRIFTQSLLTAILLLLFPLYYNGALLAEDSFHTFTDKTGNAIEAIPLLVTPDKTKLGIRRKDGREFEMLILTLSLDDQQYVKNWLKDNPQSMDFDFDFNFTKSIDDRSEIPVSTRSDTKFVTEKTSIEIEIKNLSREKLIGATLQYYIVTEHSIMASPYSNQNTPELTEWFYPYDYYDSKRKQAGKKPIGKHISLASGKAKIDDTAYNFTAEIITDPVPIREITNSNNRSQQKDTLIGVIVKITDKTGKELAVQRSIGHKFLKQSWDEISQLPPGNSSGIPPREPNN